MRERVLIAVVTGLALFAAGFVVVTPSANAAPFPDFNVCPVIGQAYAGCNTVIVINSIGSPTIYDNLALNNHPYDGIEDSLVGVQNNSGQVINVLPLAGTNIFGFDGDGICAPGYPTALHSCSWDHPTGYEGPNTSFTVTDFHNGAVNFTGGLANQAQAYFSLEQIVTSTNLIIDQPIQASGLSGTTTVNVSGLVANFTDPGPGEVVSDYSASIDWGDATSSAGTVGGSAPNFTVSGTHTYASTGAKVLTVTITDIDNPANQATAQSNFSVVACAPGAACTATATVPGAQTTQVISATGGTVTLTLGPDPSFGCAGDTFLHAPLVSTLNTTGGTKPIPKLVTATIDKSKVGTNKASQYHLCYGGGVAFTDLNNHPVAAGGSGLLPWCINLTGPGKKLNLPPCQVSSTKLPNGNVIEIALLPANDPKFW
jgi:hypothetical protein